MRSMFAILIAVCALMWGNSTASAHGCHRYPDEGRSGWHRHVGPDCERVSANRYDDDDRPRRRHRHYDDGPVCRQECLGVGPLRVCERKCY